jgi:hypothetical protein
MAGNNETEFLENKSAEEGPEGRSSGTGQRRLIRGRQGLILFIFILAGVLGGSAAYFFLPFKSAPAPAAVKPPQAVQEQEQEPLIASSRVHRIEEIRRRMRLELRSSHNRFLVDTTAASGDIDRASIQGELTLVAGLFDHYLAATASLFELSRVITNNYVEKRSQVDELYRSQVLPAFETAERRRVSLERRISHYPAIGDYHDLGFAAFQDSLALTSFQAYLSTGRERDYLDALESANSAKLILRNFWSYFQLDLKSYGVPFKPSGVIWRSYYVSWEIVE